MRINPRGSIVRTMRLSETNTSDDGEVVKFTISAPGIIVQLAHVEGRKPSDVRRDFNRYCRNNGIVVTPCEYAEGQFSKRTGKPIPGSEAIPSAYQCIGATEALGELVKHFTVKEWHFAVGVRIPVIAGGNGPEKMRPSMGSAFGKPHQIKATAVALAKQGDTLRTQQRKAWGEIE